MKEVLTFSLGALPPMMIDTAFAPMAFSLPSILAKAALALQPATASSPIMINAGQLNRTQKEGAFGVRAVHRRISSPGRQPWLVASRQLLSIRALYYARD